MNEPTHHGFVDIIKDGLHSVSTLISGSIFSQLADGVDVVMKKVDQRVLKMERRIFWKCYSFLFIAFGGIFLSLSLFYSLKEFLDWSNASAFFVVGLLVLSVGVLLKAGRR